MLSKSVKRFIVFGIITSIVCIGIAAVTAIYQNHQYSASIKAMQEREYPDLSGYFEVESCDGKECKGTFVENQRADEEVSMTIRNVRLKTSTTHEKGYRIPAYTTNKLGALCQNFSCYAMPGDNNNWVYPQE